MKKKLTALVLCTLLVAQLAVPTAQAEQAVYFVAAHNEVQPVSDETMPFWSDGYLYIPAAIFTGSVWENLGLAFTYVESERTGLLYRDAHQFLQFDLEQGYTVDNKGQITYPGGIMRNGQFFVSAYQVAKYFGLIYTVIEVEHGHLVWLREEDFGLTDQVFANAASYMISQYYTAYIKSKPAEETPSAVTPSIPDAPTPPIDPVTPELPEPTLSGQEVYLCLEAGEDTGSMLDALDYYGAQAAFFCDAAFLAEQGSLLRRMTAAGHTIALVIDAGDASLTAEEQLARSNALLKQATCGGTRLIRLKNGGSAEEELIRSAGFRRLGATLDRSGHSLRTASHARTLLQRLAAQEDDRVVVWLGSSASAAGLRSFLGMSEQAGHRCLAWTETT